MKFNSHTLAKLLTASLLFTVASSTAVSCGTKASNASPLYARLEGMPDSVGVQVNSLKSEDKAFLKYKFHSEARFVVDATHFVIGETETFIRKHDVSFEVDNGEIYLVYVETTFYPARSKDVPGPSVTMKFRVVEFVTKNGEIALKGTLSKGSDVAMKIVSGFSLTTSSKQTAAKWVIHRRKGLTFTDINTNKKHKVDMQDIGLTLSKVD